MAEEFDLYGGDIYGSVAAPSGRPKESKPSLGSYDSAGNGLEGQLADQQRRIGDLEAQLDEWHKAARESTGSYDSKLALDPRSVLAELRRGRSGDKTLLAEAPGLQQKEQRLRMMVAEKDLELLDLRRHMFTARQAASPHIAQVRQLLLDPGVAREFERLKKDNEVKATEMKALKEELQAVGFSQESKAGRMLMLKCRALQEENEEMGRELAQGKVHGLEQQVALAKGFVDDMRARYLELEDHTHQLHSEAEQLCRQVMTLKQQVRELEAQKARPPPPRFVQGPHGPPAGSGGGPRYDSRGPPPGRFSSPPGQNAGPRGYDSRHDSRSEGRKRSPPPDLRDERYSRRSR